MACHGHARGDQRVLISSGGIASLTLAYWLHHHGGRHGSGIAPLPTSHSQGVGPTIPVLAPRATLFALDQRTPAW